MTGFVAGTHRQVPQKISGCLRSTTGAEHFVIFRTVMSTAGRQAANQFEVLLGAFTGNSWITAQS